MAVELGAGYISITPSARDFGRKLASQIGNLTSQVTVTPDTRNFVGKVTSQVSGLSSQVAVTPNARNFSSTLRSQVGNQSSLGATMGDTAGEGFSSALTGAARKAVAAVAAVFAAQQVFRVGKEAFTVAADFEQTEVAFAGLLGSADLARQKLDELQRFAAVTPFEFPQLADAGKKLLAFGFSADEIIPTMGKLGDAAAALGASGSDINLVVRALGQIGSKGRVQLEELNQIAESFPGTNPVAVLAKAIGVSTQDFTKALSEPGGALTEFGLTGQQAVRILVDGLQEVPGAMGAMERQSKTLNGVLSTLRDTLRITAIQSLRPFLPGIADFILKGVVPAVEKLGKRIPAVIQTIVSAVAPGFRALGTAFRSFRAELDEGAIGRVVDNAKLIGPAFADAFNGGGVTSDGLIGVIERVGVVTGDLARKLREEIPAAIEVFSGGFRDGASGIDASGVEGKLATVGEKLGDLVKLVKDNPDVFKPIAAGLAGLGAGLIALQAGGGAISLIGALGSSLGGLATALPALISPVGLAVAAVAGLGVAAYVAYKKFVPFRAAVDSVAQTFKAAGFAAAVDEAGVQFGRLWVIVQPKLIEFRDKAIAWVQREGPEILRALGRAAGAAVGFLTTELLVPLGEWITGTALPWLRTKAGEWGAALSDWITTTALPAIAEKLPLVIDAILAWLRENQPKFTEKMGEFADAVWKWIEDTAIPKLNEKLPGIITALTEWAAEQIPKWAGQLGLLFLDAVGRLTVILLEWVGRLLVELPPKLIELAIRIVADLFGSIAGRVPGELEAIGAAILGFFTSLPGQIATAAVGMWDGIYGAFKGAINLIIRAWNGLSFSLPSVEVFGKKIGGFTLGTPDIPELAGGGVFDRDFTGLLRLAETPAARPEIVTPQRLMAETFRKVLAEVGGGHGSQSPLAGTLTINEAHSPQQVLSTIDNYWRFKMTGRSER